MREHMFAVCAYGDSPYLERCIRSLRRQSDPSDIILCTSTPSPFLQEIAGKYGLSYYVRQGESDIQKDWNFAYHMAEARLVTIAHQDDVYGPEYKKTVKAAYERYWDMTLFTSDYLVIRDGRLVPPGKVEVIKKILRVPLRFSNLTYRENVKKSALIFGNSICCPACTYNKGILGEPLFVSPYRFALDWDNLLRLAKRPGRFVCVERPLFFYRIHEGATTEACIKNNRRAREETHMFKRNWPPALAKLLLLFYKKAYD